MKNINLEYKIAGFELPHAEPGERLRRILAAALPHQTISSTQEISKYWDAEFFNLHQVKIFQQASTGEQSAILGLVNYSLLNESCFIEKAGVGYMAKMVLLAETIEERMLYAMFTADEANHFSQISNFLPAQAKTYSKDIFLTLLAEVVESAEKTVLLFVLQVVLEGWGLSHYRRLAKGCKHQILADIFTSFLQAEARHHGTGTTLFNQISVTSESKTTILEVLSKFLFMVQIGPQNVLSAIEKVKGHLTRSQKIHILEQLDTQTHSGIRLQLLRSLMQPTSANTILQTLEAQGAFTPLPPHQCVH